MLVALFLFVFLSRISIQSSPSEPLHRHLSQIATLLLSSLPLLLSSDALLAKPTHVRRECVLAFECDSQFLAYLAGLPSFVLFDVEAFVRLMLPCIWSILLAVFAFVLYAAFCQLDVSVQWLQCLLPLLLLSPLRPHLLLLPFFFFLLLFFLLLPESLSTEKALSS